MPESTGLDALQCYTTERPLALPASADKLLRQIRATLVKASNASKIATSPGEITKHVQLLREPPPNVLKDLEARELTKNAFCIVGGVKNQGHDRSLPHLERSDGAWFDFSITVREHGGALELLAYDFEIRLLPGMGAPFLRFDLNLPEHRNEARELRCHLHPGNNDLLVPAPLMSPGEVLALFVDGVRPLTSRKPRTPTDFEVSWLKETLAKVAPAPTV